MDASSPETLFLPELMFAAIEANQPRAVAKLARGQERLESLAVAGSLVILRAIELDRHECLRALAGAGADLTALVRKKEFPARWPLAAWAAMHGSINCLGELEHWGALHAVGSDQSSAAHAGAYFGQLQALRFLAPRGADFLARNKTGASARWLARQCGHEDCFDFIESFVASQEERLDLDAVCASAPTQSRMRI